MKRGFYGAIIIDDRPGYKHALSILQTSIKKGLLDPEYCDVDNKHRGSALNYEIYDYARGVVLIQRRKTTCTKYGNSPKKDYYILGRLKGKVFKVKAPKKNAIVRQAKKDLGTGYILRHIAGIKTAKELLAFKTADRILNNN